MPIVTFTTDFGLSDAYVAQMKVNVLRECPDATLIDITHQVPRHDILCGSITLERAVDGFLPGTIHLAVIDPGVGTDRRLLGVEINQQTVVCPDNGLITWSRRLHPKGASAHELLWRPKRCSATFHGRDILAPICGRLARGDAIADISSPINDPVLLDLKPASRGARNGVIIHIDHFGNATSNLSADGLRSRPFRTLRVNGRAIGKLRKTYWDVSPGKPLALIGSSGLIEIAVRDGSAASDLKLKVGDRVFLI